MKENARPRLLSVLEGHKTDRPPIWFMRQARRGALGPILLRAGAAALDRRIDQLQKQWSSGPYILDLGHGILPDTPVEHVARVTRG